jgi:hypothetical protein
VGLECRVSTPPTESPKSQALRGSVKTSLAAVKGFDWLSKQLITPALAQTLAVPHSPLQLGSARRRKLVQKLAGPRRLSDAHLFGILSSSLSYRRAFGIVLPCHSQLDDLPLTITTAAAIDNNL